MDISGDIVQLCMQLQSFKQPMMEAFWRTNEEGTEQSKLKSQHGMIMAARAPDVWYSIPSDVAMELGRLEADTLQNCREYTRQIIQSNKRNEGV